MAAVRTIRRMQDLLDVDPSGLEDGRVPVYNTAAGTHLYETVEGAGAGSLTDLADVTGDPGLGKSPVSDGSDVFPLIEIVTQTDLDEILAIVAAVKWGDIPLTNGFSNFGQGWAPARYRLTLNNVVYMQGRIKRTPPLHDSDSGLKIGSLPADSRPGFNLVFSAPCDGQNPAEIDVMADGSIVFRGLLFGTGEASWLSLSNIAYSVEGEVPAATEVLAASRA